MICYAFSVPASAFVSQVNRATSETLRLQATQEGLVPLKAWIKSALDHVIQVCLGEPDLEFAWVGDDAIDPLQQAQTLNILVGAGIKTIAEARADLGLAAEAKSAPGLGKYNPNHDERGQFATANDAVEPGAQEAKAPRGVQVAFNDAAASRSDARSTTADRSTGGQSERTATPLVVDAAYPGDFHDLVLKDELEQYAKAGASCVSEVRVQFGGVTARLDALCVAAAGALIRNRRQDRPLFELTPEQAFVYLHAMVGSGVVSPDGKINLLGLPQGEPLPAFPIIIVYVSGPGQPKRFILPTPEPETK